jgi:hypothetical protein
MEAAEKLMVPHSKESIAIFGDSAAAKNQKVRRFSLLAFAYRSTNNK